MKLFAAIAVLASVFADEVNFYIAYEYNNFYITTLNSNFSVILYVSYYMSHIVA